MAHARQRIRDALVAALAGLSVGGRIYASRLIPLADTHLPCLLVNTDDEAIAGGDVGQLLERRIAVSIRAVVKAVATFDDDLDDLVAEVEARLAGNTLGNLVKALFLESIRIEFEELDRPVGVADMRFAAVYFTNAGAPGTTL